MMVLPCIMISNGCSVLLGMFDETQMGEKKCAASKQHSSLSVSHMTKLALRLGHV